MSFALLGACAVLAVFATATGLAAVLAWPLAGRLLDAGSRHPAWRARRLFALRVLPALLGLALAVGLALPAYLLFEPPNASETPGLVLVLLTLAGALAIASGMHRALIGWWGSRRLGRRWLREGRPLELPGAPAAAYRIRDPFPVVSVVGILRSRLFVAEQVVERLSKPELAAVLAHEAGHLAAHDNLKRLALRLAPVLPWPAAARRLEEAWEQAAEEACDAQAGSALELAAALLKTARLAPAGSRLEVPAATFHRGGSLARRIRLLTERPEMAPASSSRGLRLSGIGLAGAVALGLVWAPSVLAGVHRLLECLVRLP